MSNVVVPTNVKVPAHLAGRINSVSQLSSNIAAGLGGGSSVPRISLKGSRFRIVEGGTSTVLPDLELNVVIVGANPSLSKTWFEKMWTPDSEPEAPDCYSTDGLRPATEAKKKQNDLCASCPQNQWGSKVTPQGQKIKACADQKRLAVVARDDPSGPVYLLQVTPAAIKGLNEYHKQLSMRGIPAEIVWTKLSFDTDASFPKLKFSFGGFLDESVMSVVDGLFGSETVLEVTGESTHQASVVEVAKPLLISSEPSAKAVAVAAPVVEQVMEEAKPARGFGTKKAAEPKARVTKEPTEAPVATDNDFGADIASLVDSLGFDDE